MRYKTGRIGPRLVDLSTVDFAVDTALSWDGEFPIVGKGDYLVTIGHVNGDPETVLVSRRYTSAGDTDTAAQIALSAFAERHNYETDDNDNVVEITMPEIGSGIPLPCIPCWVERVDVVTK